ncbi:MAG: hypothetical protein HFF18_00435 [Oscillospiraceae bacterium]|nr:hypothetical protein [Oscillospiraceae bacterium]
MADEERKDRQPEPYTPASPTKRILAWVGIVYMVILVLLNVYALATGTMLRGITGLMVAPACGGLAAITWTSYKKGQYRGGRTGALFVVILAAASCLLSLAWGIPALLSALGG